jgi:hypothetical protein
MTPLRVVAPVEADRVDLYATWRAEIAARDWSAVHVTGDRNRPLDLPERRGGWRG